MFQNALETNKQLLAAVNENWKCALNFMQSEVGHPGRDLLTSNPGRGRCHMDPHADKVHRVTKLVYRARMHHA